MPLNTQHRDLIVSRLFIIGIAVALCSLVWSIKLNSIVIIFLLLMWLLSGNIKAKINAVLKEKFFLFSVSMFAVVIIGYFLSDDKATAAFFVEKKLALIILPLILLSYFPLRLTHVHLILKAFITVTFLLLVIATIMALTEFIKSSDTELFFYHRLTEPLGLSAIAVSYFCILSIVFLFELDISICLKYMLSSLLTTCLILLSSKIFLFILLVLCIFHIFSLRSVKLRIIFGSILILLLALFATTENPVKKRFEDMGNFAVSKIISPGFSEEDYFDGLSLRLLFARLSYEILYEHKAFALGVGTGDAEAMLRQKIKDKGMYIGDEGNELSKGYLEYGFHNQYLQTLVQSGIAGLLALISLMVYCWAYAMRNRSNFLLALMTVFTISFFTDTWLELQAGLVSFLLLLLMGMHMVRMNDKEQLSFQRS